MLKKTAASLFIALFLVSIPATASAMTLQEMVKLLEEYLEKLEEQKEADASASASTTATTTSKVKVKASVDQSTYEDGKLKLKGHAQGTNSISVYVKKGGRTYGTRNNKVKVGADGRWQYSFKVPLELGTYHTYIAKGGKILYKDKFNTTEELLNLFGS